MYYYAKYLEPMHLTIKVMVRGLVLLWGEVESDQCEESELVLILVVRFKIGNHGLLSGE